MTHRPQSWRMVNPAECESLRENWCYSTFLRLLNSDFQNHPSWSSCCSLSPNPISDPEPKRRRCCGAQPQPPAENPCWDKSTNQHGYHLDYIDYISLLRRVNQMMIIRMSRIWWINRWQKNPCWGMSTNQHGQHFNIIIIRMSRIWWIYLWQKIARCAEQAVFSFCQRKICLD